MFWNEDVRWWLPQLVEARFAPGAEAVSLLLPCSLFSAFALLCFVSTLFDFEFDIGRDKERIAVRLGNVRKPCRIPDVGKRHCDGDGWRLRSLASPFTNFAVCDYT